MCSDCGVAAALLKEEEKKGSAETKKEAEEIAKQFALTKV